MSRRRRRDDGDLAIFALPYQHPYWAMAYALLPMIFAVLVTKRLASMVETDTTGFVIQVVQQIGMPIMYGLIVITLYGTVALAVHMWWMHTGHEYE